MSLTPEEIQALTESLKTALLPELEGQIKDTVNATVTGATSRLRKEMQTNISNLEGKIGQPEDLESTIGSTVQELISKALQGNTETTQQAPPAPGQQPQQQDPAQNGLAEVLARIKQLEDENSTLKTNFTQAQKQTEESRKAAERARLESDFANRVRDRAIDPEQLLMALERFGGVKEIDGRFAIERTDEWGNPKVVSLFDADPKSSRDLVDELLSQDRFAIHAKPIPGRGLNSEPGRSQFSNGADKPKLFSEDPRKTDTQALFNAAKTDGMDAIVADLMKTVQQ